MSIEKVEEKCCEICEKMFSVFEMEYLETQDCWICNKCLE